MTPPTPGDHRRAGLPAALRRGWTVCLEGSAGAAPDPIERVDAGWP